MRQGPLERPGFWESELNCGDQGQTGDGQEGPRGIRGNVEASTFLRLGRSTLPEPAGLVGGPHGFDVSCPRQLPRGSLGKVGGGHRSWACGEEYMS